MSSHELFATLVGKTLTRAELSEDKDRIDFETACGKKYVMFHHKDCCESVVVEDVCGDLADIVGAPIMAAEALVSRGVPTDIKNSHRYEPEHETWTFYSLVTRKGWAKIRWFGSSNGYYSEEVDFEEA